MRAAAARTFCTAGTSSPIKMAMMAMTTSSSIRVNPLLRQRRERERSLDIELPPQMRTENEKCTRGENLFGRRGERSLPNGLDKAFGRVLTHDRRGRRPKDAETMLQVYVGRMQF